MPNNRIFYAIQQVAIKTNTTKTHYPIHGLQSVGINTIAPLDSKEMITQGLLDFLQKVRNSSAPIAKAEDIKKYSRREQTKELAQLLNETVQ